MKTIQLDHRRTLTERDDGTWATSAIHVADALGPGDHLWTTRDVTREEAEMILKGAFYAAYTGASREMERGGLGSARHLELGARYAALKIELAALGVDL